MKGCMGVLPDEVKLANGLAERLLAKVGAGGGGPGMARYSLRGCALDSSVVMG